MYTDYRITFVCLILAEDEGFEPSVPCGTTVFKTAAIDHSANLPNKEKVSGLSRFLIRCNK